MLTTDLRPAAAPGDALVTVGDAWLLSASVMNVSQIIIMDKTFLTERVGRIGDRLTMIVEDGIRRVPAL